MSTPIYADQLRQAVTLFMQRDHEQARKLCLEILHQHPKAHEVMQLLGNLAHRERNLEEAITWLQRAVQIQPTLAIYHNDLAGVLRDAGRITESIQAYRAALQRDPHYAKAYFNLGNLLLQLEEFANGEKAFRQAVQLRPDYHRARLKLGESLQNLGRVEEALDAYQTVLRLTPADPEAHAYVAAQLEKANQLAPAQMVVERGLSLCGGRHLPMQLTLARLERRQGHEARARSRLHSLLDLPGAGDYAPLHYELGRMHDQAREVDAAFRHFQQANALDKEMARQRGLSLKTYRTRMNALSGYLTEANVASWRDAPAVPVARQLVFQVGFPRSGTTLLEQILGSHPGIATMEERSSLATLEGKLALRPEGFPTALSTLNDGELESLRGDYLELVKEFWTPASGKLFLDKFPLHIRLAPLIHRLFPGARFILCLRHPHDVCLSAFMQEFVINEAMVHFCDLEDTARLYDQVMGLWRQAVNLLPLRVHPMRYEALVTDFEPQVRNLLDFLSLPWDPAVLRFDRHARERGSIRTPSYHQVSQPIYDSARDRWKRYQHLLAPIVPILAPHVMALGYQEEGECRILLEN